jgi:vitamin B12 transporter
MRHFNILSFPCLTILLCGSALADGGLAETVVISATRTSQPLEVTGTPVAVITADTLKSEQTVVLTDVLKETPGLNITRNGGVGETTNISIRGSAPGQVLVLIDGVRINDPSASDGAAMLSDLLVNGIARVEVLRGPQSTLYGSQAIGGVVDITTARGGEGVSLTGSAEAGSFGTYRVNGALSGSSGIVEYGAAANYVSTGGISAADARNGNSERDPYHNFGATMNTRLHLDDTLSLDLRAYHTQSRNAFDGYPPPDFTLHDDSEYGTARLNAGYAGVNWSIFSGKLTNRFSLAESQSLRKDFDPSSSYALNFTANGESRRLEYQGVAALAPQTQLTFGAENERTTLNTTSPSPSDPHPLPTAGHVNIDSYYGELQTAVWDGLTLTGGLREDNHQTFGSHTAVKVAGAWSLWDGQTVLRANYGDGFKAPTLYHLYSQYSNPVHSLAPETATGWEAGVDQYLWRQTIRLAATYFERRTSNQIAFVSCYGVSSASCALRPSGYYDNIAKSLSAGVELEAVAKLDEAWEVTANYTHLDAVDRQTHKDLARAPHDLSFAKLTFRPAEKWSLAASVSFTGSSFDRSGQSGRLGSYALGNLYASYAVSDQLELFGRIENVWDTQYQQTLGYGTLGRAAFGGLRAKL